ncbi:MAG: hypothetical protein GC152_12425 [Alphaproteobacteria bacterium]|nr:hypothetical protein [Alphaproteobacteria bacterium]
MKIRPVVAASFAAMLMAAPGAALADKGGAPNDSASARARAKLGAALSMISMKAESSLGTGPGVAASDVVLDASVGTIAVDGRDEGIKLANVTADGYVLIDAVAVGDGDSLAATMRALGARNVTARGKLVSAQMPAGALDDLASASTFAFARPVIAETDKKKWWGGHGGGAPNFGLVQGQNDRAMGTDIVRANLGLTGKDIKIGVLSDSFSCSDRTQTGGLLFTTTAEDIANGDLPPAEDIEILSDIGSGCIDEGRAMAQLIHDVLPDAKIAFHTAFNGEADFAQGIIDLIEVGSDVIVDDVIYFTEPMFQDGIIAQAADEANRLGIPYYSSNGNRARDALQSDYRPVAFDGSTFHDWDPGPNAAPLNPILLNGALQTNLTFQWDSPNFSVSGPPGAPNDVDVVIFDVQGNRVFDCFEPGGQSQPNGLCQFKFTNGGVEIDGGNGGDAIELVSIVDFIGGQVVQIGLETQSGPPPGFFKYVIFGGGIPASQFPVTGSPSGFGHNNAAGAEGVGAAAFYFTEEFIGDPNTLPLRSLAGEPECIPACLNDFSSAGGTPILFDVAGNRLATPEVRFKPGLTAPDGINNSFFISDTSRDDDDGDGLFSEPGDPESGEFPNFFGTSAAAPNAAAVAAMMIEAEGTQLSLGFGADRIWMCKPFRNNPNRFGVSIPVRLDTDKIRKNIDKGYLMGRCDRSEPAVIRDIMRSTADDMIVRASNSTGATLQVFANVGPAGFDFDSGFGYIDAVAAVDAIVGDDD